ncbi:MAG: hypothetical protein PHS24_03520 [Bacilli bacterium]|nr:hypothetical protein [Bacilli bacterium]
MKKIFKEDITVFKIFELLLIFSIMIIFFIYQYGGHFKDAITKTTCPLIGEEYEKGDKKGDGRCIIPVGIFE